MRSPSAGADNGLVARRRELFHNSVAGPLALGDIGSTATATAAAERSSRLMVASRASRSSTKPRGTPSSTIAVRAIRIVETGTAPQGHLQSAVTSGSSRKPTPRTVTMRRGLAGSSPSLRRRADTCMSSVRVGPHQCSVPHLAHDAGPLAPCAGLRDEQAQQVELLGGELDLRLAEEGAVGGAIDPHVTGGDDVGLAGSRRRRATAQPGPQPCHSSATRNGLAT